MNKSPFKLLKIDDVALLGDGAHTKVERLKSGIPYLTAQNIKNGFIDYLNSSFISESDYQKLFSKSDSSIRDLQEDDILFSIIGTIGNLYKYKKSDKFGVSSSVAILRPLKEIIAPDYLYWILKSKYFAVIINRRKGGSVQGYTNLPLLRDIEIPVPEFIDQQKQIVKVLNLLENKISLNNYIIAELEQMVKLLYDYWWLQFDFPDRDGKPYKTSWGAMEYNEELRKEIPKGWKCIELSKIVGRIATGLNPRDNFTLGSGSNYYVTIKNIDYGKITLDDKCDKINDNALDIINKRSDLKIGDILFTSIEPVGRTYLIQDIPINWNINESVFTIRPNYEMTTSEYLYLLLSGDEIKSFTKKASTGSIHKGIRIGMLNTFKVAYSNFNLIEKFSEIVKPVLNYINVLQKQNQELIQLRDFLLPLLMNGQVKVK